MMSRTHLSIGIAASLALAPATPEGLRFALIGGSLGSMICDIDRSSEGTARDKSIGWLIAGIISAAAWLRETVFAGTGDTYRELLSDPWRLVCVAMLGGLLLFAINGAHRGFSHSLLMFFASSFFVFCISRRTSLFYAAAFLTHLLLDVLNKRPVRLLYPMRKGFCLDWFYCDGLANRILMLLGTGASAALLFCKFGIRPENFL